MRIGGLQKLTLLDFPGRVACTFFFCRAATCAAASATTRGCCAACRASPRRSCSISCAAGRAARRRGRDRRRAAAAPELPELLGKLRAMGFAVKLDTNGTHPAALRAVLEAGLVDYVAMDIKKFAG